MNRRTLILLIASSLVVAFLVLRDGGRAGRASVVTGSAARPDEAPSPRDVDALPAAPERESASRAAAETGAERATTAEGEPAEEPPGIGYLRVEAVSRESGEPLPGKRLRALVDPFEDGKTVVYASYSRGTELDALVTDELGKAEYALPAGREIRLELWDDATGSGLQHLDLAPLAAREDRAVVFRVSTEPDLAFVGQLLAQPSDAPVEAALVQLRQGGRVLEEADLEDEGFFRLATNAWRAPYLVVAAEGLTLALVPVEAGHETRATALAIRLRPAADLRVKVVDEHLMIPPDLTVVARAPTEALCTDRDSLPAGEPERYAWRTETIDGEALLEGLPSEVPLEIELVGEPFGSQVEAELITLARGETGFLSLRILPAGTLRGRLVDRGGEPVSHKEVWLVRDDSGARYLDCEDHAVARSERTDSDGRFRFDGVYAGEYLAGPCPACPRSRRGSPASFNAQHVAPVGFPVRMKSGEEKDAELVVDRELYMTLTVVDEEGGAPPGPVGVRVEPQDHPGQVDVSGLGVLPNVFLAGPLQRGAFDVTALADQERLRSPRRNVQAGAEDVELVVRPVRGRITGRVIVPPTPGEIYAKVVATGVGEAVPDPDAGPTWRVVDVDRVTGEFALEHLTPATYSLVATAGSLRAVQHVTLDSRDGEVTGVELRLTRKGTLFVETGRVRGSSPRVALETWYCEILMDGVLLSGFRFRGPTSREIDVPAGRLTVRLFGNGAGEPQTRTVTVRQGGRARAVFAY